jgi:hypothetical protein
MPQGKQCTDTRWNGPASGSKTAAKDRLNLSLQAAHFQGLGADEQTTAVLAALAAAAGGPLDPKTVAAQFKRVKTTEKKVADVLATLAGLGYVTSVDGKSFALRRVA